MQVTSNLKILLLNKKSQNTCTASCYWESPASTVTSYLCFPFFLGNWHGGLQEWVIMTVWIRNYWFLAFIHIISVIWNLQYYLLALIIVNAGLQTFIFYFWYFISDPYCVCLEVKSDCHYKLLFMSTWWWDCLSPSQKPDTAISKYGISLV